MEYTSYRKSRKTSLIISNKRRVDILKRKIISIDENKCTGCGQCIPDCPEGALQVIEGKARLISDLFCDGLGACIETCPEGAIRVIERETEPYDENAVMKNIVKQGSAVIAAHLEHLRSQAKKTFFIRRWNSSRSNRSRFPICIQVTVNMIMGFVRLQDVRVPHHAAFPGHPNNLPLRQEYPQSQNCDNGRFNYGY